MACYETEAKLKEFPENIKDFMCALWGLTVIPKMNTALIPKRFLVSLMHNM